MTRKQMTLLFLCTMMIFIVGTGVMSLIALFAQSLGATPTETGFSLAISFAAISCSTLASAWLSNYFQSRKRLIIIAAALSIPVAYMLGQSQNIFQMTVWITVLWFLFGIISTMINIITGLFADEKHRGKTFGILGAALALAQFLGGMGAGRIVERWNYSALFIAAAIVYMILLLTALMLDDKKIKQSEIVKTVLTTATHSNNTILRLLMIAAVLAASVGFMMRMAQPMMMELHHFTPSQISSAVAISGIVTFPLPFLMGWLSDRIGRRSALIVAYLLPAIGAAMMLPANLLWHFWLAQCFIAAGKAVQSVGSALITDIVPPQQLSSSISRYNATKWIGAVVGFTGTGLAIQYLGLVATMALGVSMFLIAIPLVVYATRKEPDKYATVLVGAVAVGD